MTGEFGRGASHGPLVANGYRKQILLFSISITGDERWPGQPLRTNLAGASIRRALGFEFSRRARRPAPGIEQ